MTGLDQLQTTEPASCNAKTRRMDPTASSRLPRKSILETAAAALYRLRRSSGQRAKIPSTARAQKGILQDNNQILDLLARARGTNLNQKMPLQLHSDKMPPRSGPSTKEIDRVIPTALVVLPLHHTNHKSTDP